MSQARAPPAREGLDARRVVRGEQECALAPELEELLVEERRAGLV